MKRIYLFFTGLLCVCSLFGQNRYEGSVSFSEPRVTHKDNTLILDMEMDLSGMKLASTEMVVLTPILKASDGMASKEFAPVVITGRNRTKALERSLKLNNLPVFDLKPQLFVRRTNNADQRVNVSFAAPMENWMRNAGLSFREEVTGCASCDKGLAERLVSNRIFSEPYIPTYRLAYVTPEPEPVKQRSASFKAYFNFKVGSHVLLPDYKSNAEEFAKVDKVIREIKNDKDLTITELAIEGYASPEGTFSSNMTLSKNRAYSFASYLEKTYGISNDRIKVSWYGEDWSGLKDAILESDFKQDREKVVDIIDKVDIMAGREKQLMALSAGTTYRMLLEQFFPPLRRNEYRVAYVARAFNVEEAKQILKTKPGLLSLNEIFLVAETYPRGSKEFKETLRLAADLFPDNAVANLNVATSDIETGDIDRAIERLNRISGTPDVWNNLGVAYAKKENLANAAKFFEKAGDSEVARYNLKELKKRLENN
jgi:outer membrane protein OmpA-like peptidoglycan-associated protein